MQFIEEYFTQEKNLSILFIVCGIISIVIAALFFAIIKYTLYKGVAIIFFILGLIQLSVGNFVFSQTNSNITRVTSAFTSQNNFDKNVEIERMRHVVLNLSIFRFSEIIFLLIGIGLIIFCKRPTQQFWKGIGLGLAIQACLLFTLDFIAHRNAEVYLNALIKITSGNT